VDGLIADVDAILAKLPAGAKIIPGTDRMSERKDLEAYRPCSRAAVTWCGSGRSAASTLEQAKSQGMPEKYGSFAGEFMSGESWIETLWQSVK
jgi:hypothetical protein